MFILLFKIIHTMNVNDNHIQDIIGHAIQLQKFMYDKYTYAHSHIHVVLFLLVTAPCSFLTTHNLVFMLFILPTLLY